MSNTTYVRWQREEPRTQRLFPPPREEHPAYLLPCGYCAEQLGGAGSIQLVAIGPDDEESRQRHDDYRWYSAFAVICHATCIAPRTKEELDKFAAELAPLLPTTATTTTTDNEEDLK